MTEQSKTIAVAGSSPFALLLAGLLAADHSREIVLVTGPSDPHRLATNLSLSVAPITRPQTWAYLRANGPETVKRISRIAPDAVTRRDVVFTAHAPALGTGLRHVHHMAAGFGHVVERWTDAHGPGTGIKMRDVFAISERAFSDAAWDWLSKSGVRIERDPSAFRLRKNGASRVGDQDVDLSILADDAAMMVYLGSPEIASIGSATPMISLVTAPVGPHAYPITLNIDSDVAIAQSPAGSLEIIAPGTGMQGLDQIAAHLDPGIAPRRAAQSTFTRLVPHEGAPSVGMLGRGRTFVAAGLGPLDMMLAPLIARAICGRARGTEADWIRSHQPRGRKPRPEIVDLAPTSYGGAP